MESVSELKREVAGYLRGHEGLQGARILEAFPAAQRDFPLKKPVVAVGIDGVEAASEGFGDYWGDNGTDRLHGAAGDCTPCMRHCVTVCCCGKTRSAYKSCRAAIPATTRLPGQTV